MATGDVFCEEQLARLRGFPETSQADIEDEEFGHREECLGGTTVRLTLWRHPAGRWTLAASYQGEPPPDGVVDEYRAGFLAAIHGAGLVVNREWRR